MNQPTIYVASAGTGKTTALLAELEEALQNSAPEKIIFTTFTNAGAQELAHRALQKYPHFKETQFRYFRTLHSICYRNIPRRNLLNFGDYIELAKETGLSINPHKVFNAKEASATTSFSKGDHLLYLDSLARNKLLPWEEAAAHQTLTHFSAGELKSFSETFRAFRKKYSKYDFTDQLEIFLESTEYWNPPLTHLLIDEAQDLSPLQWKILNIISKKVEKTVIAGDDKQAIYSFNGGDPETLIKKTGTRKILETTYRLPHNLLQYSEKIAHQIHLKQDYSCKAQEEGGEVRWIHGIRDVQKELQEGTWFILVRNRRFMEDMEAAMMKTGLLFTSDSGNCPISEELIEAISTWKSLCRGYAVEARIVKSIYQNYLRGTDTVAHGFKKTIQQLDNDESITHQELREGFGLQTDLPWDQCFHIAEGTRDSLLEIEKREALDKKPRIRITTIHAVKGREADNVILLPDLSRMTMLEYRNNPDEEHRVFYVGATRSKKKLFLHQPITDDYYRLPQP